MEKGGLKDDFGEILKKSGLVVDTAAVAAAGDGESPKTGFIKSDSPKTS